MDRVAIVRYLRVPFSPPFAPFARTPNLICQRLISKAHFFDFDNFPKGVKRYFFRAPIRNLISATVRVSVDVCDFSLFPFPYLSLSLSLSLLSLLPSISIYFILSYSYILTPLRRWQIFFPLKHGQKHISPKYNWPETLSTFSLFPDWTRLNLFAAEIVRKSHLTPDSSVLNAVKITRMCHVRYLMAKISNVVNSEKCTKRCTRLVETFNTRLNVIMRVWNVFEKFLDLS